MATSRGRPSKNPKTVDTRIRLSEDEARMLEFCSQQTGETKSDIIRKGIKKVYDEIVRERYGKRKK